MINIIKLGKPRTNHILNIALAMQLIKEFTPDLSVLVRLGKSPLNTCGFNCEVWEQLNLALVEEGNAKVLFSKNGRTET